MGKSCSPGSHRMWTARSGRAEHQKRTARLRRKGLYWKTHLGTETITESGASVGFVPTNRLPTCTHSLTHGSTYFRERKGRALEGKASPARPGIFLEFHFPIQHANSFTCKLINELRTYCVRDIYRGSKPSAVFWTQQKGHVID
jgi:hypothetical protein